MIISKTAVLALAIVFCPSDASTYDDISNHQHGSFHHTSSSSTTSKRKNKNEDDKFKDVASSTNHLPLAFSLSSREAEENLSTYAKVEVLTNKNKSSRSLFETTVTIDEGQQGDDLVVATTFAGEKNNKLDVTDSEEEARAATKAEEQEIKAAAQRIQDNDYRDKDANVGILSLHDDDMEDIYYHHHGTREEAAHDRHLNLIFGTGSCTGFEACLYAQATIGDNSCNGVISCYTAGKNGLANIGNESCIGNSACYHAGEDGQATIGNRSCAGGALLSCFYAGYEGLANIDSDSCDGEKSCYNAGYKGLATIGMGSCLGNKACKDVGLRSSSRNGVVIGNSSCQGIRACSQNGRENVSFTVGYKSCNCDECCENLPDGSYIGDGQCNSIFAGCSNQHEPVNTRTPSPSLSSAPSLIPSFSSKPSLVPSFEPSVTPSLEPSHTPSFEPSIAPSESSHPSDVPSTAPSLWPSGLPSSQPSNLIICVDRSEHACAFSLDAIEPNTITVSTKTAICTKRTDTKKGTVEYRNECVSNEDILGLASGSLLLSSSKDGSVEETLFSCGCCDPDSIAGAATTTSSFEKEKEEESKIKYADSEWCLSNNGEGGPLCAPDDEIWDPCKEASSSLTPTKSTKKLRHRHLGNANKSSKSSKKTKKDKVHVNVCIRQIVNGLEMFSTECRDPFLDTRQAVVTKGGGTATASATVVVSCGACTEE